MEDLGDVIETHVEFFRCIQQQHNALPSPTTAPFPPPDHANLLAASSRYGHLFAAVADHIIVHSLRSLREKAPGALPVARLDLKQHNVHFVKSLALVLDDTVLVLHAAAHNPAHHFVILLNCAALVQGKALLLSRPLHAPQLAAVAVSPQRYDRDHHTDSQFLAVLVNHGDVAVHKLTPESEGDGFGLRLHTNLSGQDPFTCMALSPDDDMIALGSMRGSVNVHATEDMSQLATIVEVESGWHPFALHFLSSDALLVSYACGESVSHVVWTLVTADGELVVRGHSPLGELCYASPLSPPASEDGDEKPEYRYSPPVISCSPIPGWDMCVVASSLSTDVEVISLNEDGIWENWKFDEGKYPTLPTDANDNDTKPVGIALDLTDTASIESPEPAAPRVNPMPRLITFTTDLLLLPFALIDDRPDAVCDFIYKPLPLPPIPVVDRPTEKDTFPRITTNHRETPPLPPISVVDRPTEKSTVPDLTPNDREALPVLPIPVVNRPTEKDIIPDLTPNDRESVPLQPPIPVVDQPLEQVAFPGLRANDRKTESGSPRLSVKAPEVQESPPKEWKEGTPVPFSFGKGASEPASGQTDLFTPRKQITVPHSTPAYPPPRPDFVDAFRDIELGKPLDLIRSVLLEMAKELNYNRAVEQATNMALRETNSSIMPLVDSVRSGLVDILNVLRERFRDEATLRREVLDSLKEMMTLSREYESTSLEFQVREEEGFASRLQAEDKAIDDQIAKKEAEVLRSISAIEERLTANRIPERRINQSEQLQQMYSSLILQGIRVRKIHGLLSALSERIDELDKGGRRTNLGLSMARLERLSISQKEEQRTDDYKVSGTKQNAAFLDGGTTFKKPSRVCAELPSNVEGTLMSNEVQKVLRRLAMRAGRANISVKPLPRRQKTEAVTNTSEDSELSFTQVGAIQDTSRSAYGTVDKPTPVFSSSSFSNVGNGESKAPGGVSFSPGKRSTFRFDGTASKINEGWSATLRPSPSLARKNKSLSSSFGRSQTAPAEVSTKTHTFSLLPQSSFGTKKTAFPGSQPESDVPPSTAPEIRDNTSGRELRMQTEASENAFGALRSDQPSSGSAGKKRNKDGESLSFESTEHTEVQSSREKPPFGPPKLSVADPKRTLSQPLGSPSFSLRETGNGSVELPRAGNAKDGSSAPLPSDENQNTTASDISSRDEVRSETVPAPSPDYDLEGNLVASLARDDNNLAAQSVPPGSDDAGQAAQSQQAQAVPASSSAASMFGMTSSLFGNVLVQSQSQPSQFSFGTEQTVEPTESPSVREATADIQAGSSEDSDLEENRRSTGDFGMQAMSMTSNASSQSAFAGFGNQVQSGQDGTTSAFAQTGTTLFDSPRSQSGPFGASSMQDSQGMSFGASGSQGESSSPFVALGTSSSSFASPSGFGESAQFGAPSTLASGARFGSATQGRGGSQFGATSQLGGGAQFGASSQIGSQFGASSQLGAGFGAQSPLGGGTSLFAAQGGTGSGGFGSGTAAFGGGVPTPQFGESSFGTPQQSAFGGGESGLGGGESPFRVMGGSLFGGQSAGGSGFAALAGSQPFGGTAGSGFGSGTTPVFGNGSGPPSFTSAAFAQRRA